MAVGQGAGCMPSVTTGARSADGKPTTSVYLGLHVGDVFYGNVGSDDRLDFTVIGPAVNEVCRIAAAIVHPMRVGRVIAPSGAAARGA